MRRDRYNTTLRAVFCNEGTGIVTPIADAVAKFAITSFSNKTIW